MHYFILSNMLTLKISNPYRAMSHMQKGQGFLFLYIAIKKMRYMAACPTELRIKSISQPSCSYIIFNERFLILYVAIALPDNTGT
jgi:hypothetical protein